MNYINQSLIIDEEHEKKILENKFKEFFKLNNLQFGGLPTPPSTSELQIGGPGLRGIQNCGTSCYVNAVIQLLSNMPDFRNSILNLKELNETKTPFTFALQNVFKLLWKDYDNNFMNTNNTNTFIKSEFIKNYFITLITKSKIGPCESLGSGTQEDADQGLSCIFKLMENENKAQYIKNNIYFNTGDEITINTEPEDYKYYIKIDDKNIIEWKMEKNNNINFLSNYKGSDFEILKNNIIIKAQDIKNEAEKKNKKNN